MWSKLLDNNSISNYSKQIPPIKSLHNNFQKFYFFKGDVIPQESYNLWLIESGVVKSFALNLDSKITTLGYWIAKDVVGLPLSKSKSYRVTCIKDCEAIFIPWENCSLLYQEISSCTQQTEELLRIVRIKKMYSRLSKLLLWFVQKFGKQTINGILIDIHLTHQDLADIMGSNRVTVTRLINELERESIIFRPCRFSIVIINFDALKSATNSF